MFLLFLFTFVFGELVQETGLADTHVSDNDVLENVFVCSVVVFCHL